MKSEALERVWMLVRDELRRQRGMNRFRGNEVHLLPQKQIRIPVEPREGKLRNSEMVIRLTEIEADLSALLVPEGKLLHMRDFNYRLSEFVAALLAEVRGESYLHTNSKSADYRKAEEETT